MTLDGRVLVSALMFAIFVGMSAMALGFPAKAGFLPLLIGVPGTLLCAAQLAIDLRGAATSPQVDGAEADRAAEQAAPTATRERFMFFWLAVFTAGLLAFGFLVAGPILVFLYLWAGERETVLTALFAAIGTTLVLWAGFDWLLELSLFPGLIGQHLYG